jgi:hypothetical protein
VRNRSSIWLDQAGAAPYIRAYAAVSAELAVSVLTRLIRSREKGGTRMTSRRFTASLTLLAAIAIIMATATQSSGSLGFKCIKIAKPANGESGNFTNSTCTTLGEGEYVIANPVAFRDGTTNQWCAEVAPASAKDVVGYANIQECLLLPSAVTVNAPWVKVRGAPPRPGGGTSPATFRVLPSVKTFKGMSAPSTLTAGSEATTTCEEGSDSGEITSMDKVGKLVLTFTGCTVTASGKACTIKSVGAAKEGEIVTRTLKGELGTVKASEAASEVGLLLEPETTKRIAELAETSCAPATRVNGSLAAEILPISEKTLYGGLNFEARSDKQNIKSITVLSGKREPELEAYGVDATYEVEDGIEFGSEAEIT